MTTKQKLLALVLLGLMVAGIVLVTIRAFGFAGGTTIGILFVFLFFFLGLAVFRD